MNPTASDFDLSARLKTYRKQARMPQWVLAQILDISDHSISDVELVKPVSADIKRALREYLNTAPKPRRLRDVRDKNRTNNIYLTMKLMTWARITGMDSTAVDAARVLKEAYDRAKREQGLANIPLIQLEVENALTLATRGRYRREVLAQRLVSV